MLTMLLITHNIYNINIKNELSLMGLRQNGTILKIIVIIVIVLCCDAEIEKRTVNGFVGNATSLFIVVSF